MVEYPYSISSLVSSERAPMSSEVKFSQYAHPEALVSVQWLSQHLNDDSIAIVECDEDILLYQTGHIPGARKLDWHTELNDPVVRDYLEGPAFAQLMTKKGIRRDHTVVIYGDKSNWWATYAFWVFKLFGHKDVRILDGGRDAWIAAGLPFTKDVAAVTASEYPVIARQDAPIRAFRDDVLKHLGQPLIDVRSPQEYSGERTHMPDYPEEGALRGGHIPTAKSVPWSRSVNEDQTFKSRAELEDLYYAGAGLKSGDNVIAYCRIGERSSHTWFVLTYLLGMPGVRNYDGSWTEWGCLVKAPIVKGTEPGTWVH
jgi:thiosulfate/3-mercaptopyruvate sulfurtransferase